MKIIVGSRESPLAKAQVQEVLEEIHLHFPNIAFACLFVRTTGDNDQQTSLRTLDKTDFFTREIDTLLLERTCRIAIHSAKDLPEPLPRGLSIAAITKGVDPSDSLVLGPNPLPSAPIIATSSVRREEAVKQVLPHASFIDLRGTIDQRLVHLKNGTAHGIVVAEAALIRLKLTHLNRIKLPGTTVPLQGQLAIVVREEDDEMHALFSCIDCRYPCKKG